MNKVHPLVSIIIPTYNRAHLIGETLDSVLAQTYQNWECIIVDDGSSDNTDEVVGEYVIKDPRFQYHHRPADRPKGANSCRNYGFEVSKGEYVNWFDDDDLMHPDKLLLQLNSILECKAQFSVCQTLLFENTPEHSLGLRHPNIVSNDPFNDFIANKIKWLTPSVLFQKEPLVAQNLQFDETLHKHQEWDFFIRLLMRKHNFVTIEKALVYYRKHAESVTYGKKTFEKHMALFYARHKLLSHPQAILISKENIRRLKMELCGILLVYLRNKNFKTALELKNELFRIEFFTALERFKMRLAFLSFKLTGKGEILLKK